MNDSRGTKGVALKCAVIITASLILLSALSLVEAPTQAPGDPMPIDANSSAAPPKDATSITLSSIAMEVNIDEVVHLAGALYSSLSGVDGAVIELSISFHDGDIMVPTQNLTAVTDCSGTFSIDYLPPKAGQYRFDACFKGNDHFSGSSTRGCIDVVVPESEPFYDYIVLKNEVRTSGGDVVYDGASFTAALSWALCKANKITYVPAGAYNISSPIYPSSGVTLFGDGCGYDDSATVFNFSSATPSSERFTLYDVCNVNFSNFRMINGAIWAYACETDAGNMTFRNIIADGGGCNNCSFALQGHNFHTLSNISYNNCIADETDGIGFGLFGDYTGLVKNVIFLDCIAQYCGYKPTRMNSYSVGFDLAETTNVSAISCIRCFATYCWESGFHLENAPFASTVVLSECIASFNGQKPMDYDNGDGTYGPQFGVGFYIPTAKLGNSVILSDCSGADNTFGLSNIWRMSNTINTKVWDQMEEGSASSGHWYPSGTPTSSDDVVFCGEGMGTCIWDLNGPNATVNSIYLGSEAGALVQSQYADINLGIGGYHQVDGTLVGAAGRVISCAGDFVQAAGAIVARTVMLNMTGDGSKLITSAILIALNNHGSIQAFDAFTVQTELSNNGKLVIEGAINIPNSLEVFNNTGIISGEGSLTFASSWLRDKFDIRNIECQVAIAP
jgi:hypothetical protein